MTCGTCGVCMLTVRGVFVGRVQPQRAMNDMLCGCAAAGSVCCDSQLGSKRGQLAERAGRPG
jgi:hypothetical protein